MNIEQQKNILLKRNEQIKDLKTLSSAQIDQLMQEIKAEHQKLIFAEAQETDLELKKLWRQLSQQNESQLTVVSQYLSVQYQHLAKSSAPKTPIWQNTLRAFLVGGLICTIGQLVINYCTVYQQMEFKVASGLASVVIILLAGLLTGLGIYDEIGRFGGAGSMVPISGFSNSIVSAALEFKREGMVYGIGAKIFTIAGPVILYGTLTAVVIGLIHFIIG